MNCQVCWTEMKEYHGLFEKDWYCPNGHKATEVQMDVDVNVTTMPPPQNYKPLEMEEMVDLFQKSFSGVDRGDGSFTVILPMMSYVPDYNRVFKFKKAGTLESVKIKHSDGTPYEYPVVTEYKAYSDSVVTCAHDWKIVHGFLDTWEQCAHCKTVKQ